MRKDEWLRVESEGQGAVFELNTVGRRGQQATRFGVLTFIPGCHYIRSRGARVISQHEMR